MTKSPITLQELRRRIYVKAKAEKSWRFLRQGFGWKRWRQPPLVCPKCKSPYWNRPRKGQARVKSSYSVSAHVFRERRLVVQAYAVGSSKSNIV